MDGIGLVWRSLILIQQQLIRVYLIIVILYLLANPMDLRPSDIPSEQVLKQMGLSEEEIAVISSSDAWMLSSAPFFRMFQKENNPSQKYT